MIFCWREGFLTKEILWDKHMRTKFFLTAGIIFLAMMLFSVSAFASNVGRRFPSEKRSFKDEVTGLTVTALTTDLANDSKIYQTHPQWTSDGQYIIFRSNRASQSESTGEEQSTSGRRGGRSRGRSQAFAVHDLDRYAEAKQLYEKALAIYEKVHGPEHVDVAWTLYYLGWLHDDLGQYAKAVPLYERCLAIREKVLGSQHRNVAACLNRLGRTYAELGQNAEAEPRYRRALEIWEKALGPEDAKVAAVLHSLGYLYSDEGR